MNRSRKERDIVYFAETSYVLPEKKKTIKLLPHQKEILRLCFTRDDKGIFPYQTIVYSCPKKGGKTELGGLVGLWFAASESSFNEVYYIANDLEQAQSRGYRRVCQIIDASKEYELPLGTLDYQRSLIKFPDGTEIKAISTDYAGAAGANQGLTIWDELWAYRTDDARRLWAEMTPVPTRLNSLRLVLTYAGFENESKLLKDLYDLGKKGHRLFTDEELDNRYPDMEELYKDALRYIWVNEDARLFLYWDNKPRMSWQTPAYYATQRRICTPNEFRRLHQNEWVQSMESGFIPVEDWDKCIDPNLSPVMPGLKQPLFLGVDIATKRDTCAVAGVYWDYDKKKIILANHRIWQPTQQEPLDFESTVEHFILDLYNKFSIAAVYYDPSQFVRSAQFLSGKGIPLTEYLQVPTNLTSMTQILYELGRGHNILMYPSPDLRRQNMDCSIIDTGRGMRIAKEKASRKIDAIVALAMACQAAWDGCGLTPLPDSQPEASTKWQWQAMSPSVVDVDEDTSRMRSRWRI